MRIKSMTAIFVTTMAFAAYAGDAARPTQVAMSGNDTQKFFEEAASANKLEVEVGRLAAQKASNPQLKSFGQQMVTDHTKASLELQTLPSCGCGATRESRRSTTRRAESSAGFRLSLGASFDASCSARSVPGGPAQILQTGSWAR